jgi:hypothetical protein
VMRCDPVDSATQVQIPLLRSFNRPRASIGSHGAQSRDSKVRHLTSRP